MQPQVKESIRNEIKILTFRRRNSKEKYKKLQREAEDYCKWLDNNTTGLYTYKNSAHYFLTAEFLRYDGRHKARHYNIAYGLLRGKSYREIENKCKIQPNPETILSIIHNHVPWWEKKEWTLDRVKKLLQ